MKVCGNQKMKDIEFHIVNLNSISHNFFEQVESEQGKVERDEIDLRFVDYVYFLLFSHVNNIRTLLILMATLTLFIK